MFALEERAGGNQVIGPGREDAAVAVSEEGAEREDLARTGVKPVGGKADR